MITLIIFYHAMTHPVTEQEIICYVINHKHEIFKVKN